jgi:hypothetical protein
MQTNLDVKRLLCPMPVIRLGEMIEKIEIGDTIIFFRFKVKSSKRYYIFSTIKTISSVFSSQASTLCPCTLHQAGISTESILMSLPPLVRWEYQYQPKAGSPEAKLYEYYLKPQDWINAN